MKAPYMLLHMVLGWCNLTIAATSIYIYLGIPLIMREHGWSGTEIGLFQVSGLPIVLKFLLASPVDKFRFQRANYLKWAGMLCVAYILCLFAFAWVAEQVSFQALFAIALLMTLVSTWLDVPVNAFVIKRLPESERTKAGGIRSSATALASVLGGGLMLLLYAQWGWAWPFIAFAAMTLMGVAVMLWAYWYFPADFDLEAKPVTTSLVSMWVSYFKRSNMLWWNLILMLHFPFVGAAWLYLKPTLLELGVGMSDIAWLSAWAGVTASLASFMYAQSTHRLPPYKALPLFSVLNVLALWVMYNATQWAWSDWQLIAAVLLVAVALGLSSGVLFGLVMRYCRVDLSANDYGVQTSLFSLSRILVPISAGVLLDKVGFAGMYFVLTCCALLVALVCIASVFKGGFETLESAN